MLQVDDIVRHKKFGDIGRVVTINSLGFLVVYWPKVNAILFADNRHVVPIGKVTKWKKK